MGRRRHFAPDQDLVHVSFKCVGDAFLMRPDAYANYVVAVALEEAAEKYGVRIHAFCFLSNHAHLLLGIAGCRLDSVMQYVKSLIALALNAHHERDGAFFKRRYRAEPILSDAAAVGIEQYVHQQALSPRVGAPDPVVAPSSLALLHRLHTRAGRARGGVAGPVLLIGGDRGALERRGLAVRRRGLA